MLNKQKHGWDQLQLSKVNIPVPFFGACGIYLHPPKFNMEPEILLLSKKESPDFRGQIFR